MAEVSFSATQAAAKRVVCMCVSVNMKYDVNYVDESKTKEHIFHIVFIT